MHKGKVLISCLLQLPPFSGQFVKLVLHVLSVSVCIILEISSLLSKDYPGLLSALLDEHDFRVHGLL